MRPLTLMIGLLGAAMLPYQCGAQISDDPFAEYFQRGLTIAPEGGNAKDANAAIHTIDPWPPYASHTRIPDDGRRAVNGIERMYRIPNPFPLAAGTVGGAGTTGGGGASVGAGTGSGSFGMGAGTMGGAAPGTSGGY